MIVKGGTANALTYNLNQTQSFAIEAISADVDCSAAPGDSVCDAIYRDNAGLLIARSRSSFTLPAGQVLTVTFAPDLPDTYNLGNFTLGTVITTGLPATTLPPGGSVTVQVEDPAATVTQMRLWVRDANLGGDGGFTGDLQLGPYLLVPGLAA